MDNLEQNISLVMQLRRAGISNTAVLKVVEQIPRHRFVEGLFKERAYENVPLPIAHGQTISQPSIVALMTEALEPDPRAIVLEVGTGSGYQAAILSKLFRRVYSIERVRDLSLRASQLFEELRLTNITSFIADGSHGLPTHAPFDRIILTAAAEDPPKILLNQLALGGIMVLPVGQSDHIQKLIKIVKTEKGLEYQELCEVRFVPLIEGVVGSDSL